MPVCQRVHVVTVGNLGVVCRCVFGLCTWLFAQQTRPECWVWTIWRFTSYADPLPAFWHSALAALLNQSRSGTTLTVEQLCAR